MTDTFEQLGKTANLLDLLGQPTLANEIDKVLADFVTIGQKSLKIASTTAHPEVIELVYLADRLVKVAEHVVEFPGATACLDGAEYFIRLAQSRAQDIGNLIGKGVGGVAGLGAGAVLGPAGMAGGAAAGMGIGGVIGKGIGGFIGNTIQQINRLRGKDNQYNTQQTTQLLQQIQQQATQMMQSDPGLRNGSPQAIQRLMAYLDPMRQQAVQQAQKSGNEGLVQQFGGTNWRNFVSGLINPNAAPQQAPQGNGIQQVQQGYYGPATGQPAQQRQQNSPQGGKQQENMRRVMDWVNKDLSRNPQGKQYISTLINQLQSALGAIG